MDEAAILSPGNPAVPKKEEDAPPSIAQSAVSVPAPAPVPTPAPAPAPPLRRLDESKLTWSYMKSNPLYAIFTFMVIYIIFRLVITFIWPVIRPWVVRFVLFITRNLYITDLDPESYFFMFVRMVWVGMHFLFERVIYYYVCGWFLDYVVVVILAIFLFMFAIWCVWKYILVFPVKDILGAILQVTPPFSFTWDMFEQFDEWLGEDMSSKFASTVQYIGEWFGLILDEGQARAGAGGSSTDGSVARDGIAPTPSAKLTRDQATLKAASSGCRENYQPTAFSDPFSQAMVRNELTKCELSGLRDYYVTAEPEVAKAMDVCTTAQALAARHIPSDEFVTTASLKQALSAYGNRWGIYNDSGDKVLRNAKGVVVVTVLDGGVMEIRNAGGMVGYLDAQKHRVMPSGGGDFVPLSTNMENAIAQVRATNITTRTQDPVSALIQKENALIECQIDVMRTKSNASYAEDMRECDNGDSVDDPADNSTASWSTYGSAVGSNRGSIGHCQADKLKTLKRSG